MSALEVIRDWTPRSRSGGIYCSPACGGSRGFCKRADYDRVTKEAAKLAARLGEGWEPEVWENLGWHYRVSRGAFEVHRDKRDGSFDAWFQGEKQFSATAETPEDAIGFVTQDVRTFIRRIENQLSDMA